MLLNPSLTLESVLAGAVAASQPEFHVDYVLYNEKDVLTKPAPYRGALNSTTDVTLLAAPPQGFIAEVREVSIYNKDTSSITVTVKTTDGSTDYIKIKWVLLTLETLHYDDQRGWYATDANGNIKTSLSAATNWSVSADLSVGQQVTSLNGITTSGNFGVPAVVATGRSAAQTAAVASVSTYTVGGADGSFEVSANVNVTTSTTHSFTVTCAYTDEGNTARTLTLGFTQLSGATFITAITNVTGAGPYESPIYHIRCKSGTAITIATTGTFTTVTYNAEGIIKQVN